MNFIGYKKLLKNLEDQTEKICKEAVKQDGYALEFVDKEYRVLCEKYILNNKKEKR